jgi:lipid-binding SYLF domain-containing protein
MTAQDTRHIASSHSQATLQGFSLPGETDKAAKILASFLADPTNPVSALNAIPKAVIQRAKGALALTQSVLIAHGTDSAPVLI